MADQSQERFDHTSILFGIDKNDAASIRRVMHGFSLSWHGMTKGPTRIYACLTSGELVVLDQIIEEMQESPLIVQMVVNFASGRYLSRAQVIARAAILDSLVTEAVRSSTADTQEEREATKQRFLILVASREFAFIEGGDEEQEGFVSSDIDKQTQATGPKKIKAKEISTAEKDVSTVLEHDGGLPVPPQKLKKQLPVSNLKKRTNIFKKRFDNERWATGATYDRVNARVSQVDDSKLKIAFSTEREDASQGGKIVPVQQGEFLYPLPEKFRDKDGKFDWNNKLAIKALNFWRGQVFRRNLGMRETTRIQWTASEREYLLAQLNHHLASAEVGGRFSQINWEKMTADFNNHFNGQTFAAGEILASSNYKSGGNQITKGEIVQGKNRPLKQARKFCSRNVGALQNQLHHFNSPEAQELIKKAKAADATLRASSKKQASDGDNDSDGNAMEVEGDEDEEIQDRAEDVDMQIDDFNVGDDDLEKEGLENGNLEGNTAASRIHNKQGTARGTGSEKPTSIGANWATSTIPDLKGTLAINNDGEDSGEEVARMEEAIIRSRREYGHRKRDEESEGGSSSHPAP